MQVTNPCLYCVWEGSHRFPQLPGGLLIHGSLKLFWGREDPRFSSDVGEIVMARTRLEGRTNDAFGKGGALERGQAQVPDFDRACRACDEDVVTLEIPVQYRGDPGV